MTPSLRFPLLLSILTTGILQLSPAGGADDAQQPPAPAQANQQIEAAGRNIAGLPAMPSQPRSRYKTLLKWIEVPNDAEAYGDFCDFGFWSGTSYAGYSDLPAGYWVYLAPKWYIFKEDVSSSAAPQRPRPWSPEQATGAPDTWPKSGDLPTAWASRTPDGQREWLQLTYASPVRPTAVLIYETFNPGAVDRVTSIDDKGNETELWSGTDPTPAGKDKGICIIPVQAEGDVKCIRIYLDSPKVPGWNEIDAVGLLDEKGVTKWAASATASSTYADVTQPPPTEVPVQLYQLR